ncbi:hypothetical protein QLR68_34820, partial [Micromonospora sp. DH15]|nr:hypothetical protein [Micromonospora sp. DH15]
LGAAPLPEYTAPVVAALSGEPVPVAEDRLDRLVDAGLLGTGAAPGRYVLHTLLALFAAERFAGDEAAGDREAARGRLAAHLRGRGAATRPAASPGAGGPGSLR